MQHKIHNAWEGNAVRVLSRRSLLPPLMLEGETPCVAGRILAIALIAYACHGKDSHVDRESGESRIDLNEDRNRRRAERFRQAKAQTG